MIESHKTIDRVLKVIGINRYFAARKFQLTERHKLIRYQFCKSYFNWNSNQWSYLQVFFQKVLMQTFKKNFFKMKKLSNVTRIEEYGFNDRKISI